MVKICEYNKTNNFQLFIHLTRFVVDILVKFYCFPSQFVPNLEAKSVVPGVTTRDWFCGWSLTKWIFVTGTKCDSFYDN